MLKSLYMEKDKEKKKEKEKDESPQKKSWVVNWLP